MRRLYREDKPKFYTIVMAFWVALGTFGIFRGWSILSLVMCASMAASAFLFIGTSKKDAEWIAEHGDPDEYEKKMKQLEKEAALRAAGRGCAGVCGDAGTSFCGRRGRD